MTYIPKPNTGTLFINDKKEKDTHPDKNGNAMIACPHCRAEYKVWLSGWEKDNGRISLAIKPAEEKNVPSKSPDPIKHPHAPPDYQEKHSIAKANAFKDDELPDDF